MTRQNLLKVYRAFWKRDFTKVVELLALWPETDLRGQAAVRLRTMGLLSRINLGMGAVDLGTMKALFLQLNGSLRFSLGYAIALQCKYRQDFAAARRYLDRLEEGENTSLKKSLFIENERGNLDLAESYFESALGHYENATLALDHLELNEGRKMPELFRVVQMDNTGYIHLLLGRQSLGMELIHRAVEAAEKAGLWAHLAECYQDLAFAHSLQRHWAKSIAVAELGLALSEKGMPLRVHRNLLVLLGQGLVHVEDGPTSQRLAEVKAELAEHFPGNGVNEILQVPELISALNLKA